MAGSQPNPADPSDGLLGLYVVGYLEFSGPPSSCRPDDSPWTARFKGAFAGAVVFLVDIFSRGLGPTKREHSVKCQASTPAVLYCPHFLTVFKLIFVLRCNIFVFFVCCLLARKQSVLGPRTVVVITSFICTHHTVMLLASYAYATFFIHERKNEQKMQ